MYVVAGGPATNEMALKAFSCKNLRTKTAATTPAIGGVV
jgi:hypothetical protein